MKFKDMSEKQSNTPIHDIQNDTVASVISVTSESDDQIRDAKHMTTASTTHRWKWYLVFFGLQLILVSSVLEL